MSFSSSCGLTTRRRAPLWADRGTEMLRGWSPHQDTLWHFMNNDNAEGKCVQGMVRRGVKTVFYHSLETKLLSPICAFVAREKHIRRKKKEKGGNTVIHIKHEQKSHIAASKSRNRPKFNHNLLASHTSVQNRQK